MERAALCHLAGADHLEMLEAYSHEVSSCGYWPDGDQGLFYSYIYSEPDGFRDAPVQPDGAHYSEKLGEFVLPYKRIQESVNPENLLRDFLQTTYEAAAEHAGWQRPTLERTT